ncbi:MAG: 16S rRNA (cytosine(967)-C(5))-methyltransferase RsmB [Dethiobacteria bacterium]
MKKKEVFRRGAQSARELALQVLMDLETNDGYVNLTLSRHLQRTNFEGVERALASELAYGVITRLNTLDWRLEQFLNKPLEKLTVPVRNILRLGLYQILFMEKIPHRAAVDESVKLAHRYGHRGVAGLVNAVLRRSSREGEPVWPECEENPYAYLALKESHPEWIVRRWVRRFGFEETLQLCEANNKPPALSIRVNSLKVTKNELVTLLEEEGVEVKESRYCEEGLLIKSPIPLTSLTAFNKGLFAVQGESAMLATKILSSLPGEKVADLCAAPGGKTTHLAQLMQNRGKIAAVDLSAKRLNLVKEAAERLGCKCIETITWDATDHTLVSKYFGFDRVFLDAPCSGLGVIRRKPDLKWRKKEKDLKTLASVQYKLLQTGRDMLRPGGFMLYCVCTNEPEETEGLIYLFLKQNPSLSLVDFSEHLPSALKVEQLAKGMLHLYPHRHGVDGFFMAKLVKHG